MLAVILTATYSTRLLHSIFISSFSEVKSFNNFFIIIKKWDAKVLNNKDVILTEINLPMFISMFVLLLCSITFGFIASDLFIGFGVNTWINVFITKNINYSLINIEFVSPIIKNLPIILSLFCVFITSILLNFLDVVIETDAIFIIKWYNKNSIRILNYLSAFSYHAGFFNLIYNNIFFKYIKYMYFIYLKTLDRGIFEFFGPNGVYLLLKNLHYYYKNWFFVYLSFTLYIIFIFVFIFIFMFMFYNLLNIFILSPLLFIDSSFLFILFFIITDLIIKKE